MSNEIDSEILMLRSKLNQSFRVEEKKEYLTQSVRKLNMGILLSLIQIFGSPFETKFIK